MTWTGIERIGKETVIGADDDPDPSEPISPKSTYTESACSICGEPLIGKHVYCSDRCRKRGARRQNRALHSLLGV
jgi:hypothetical protein